MATTETVQKVSQFSSSSGCCCLTDESHKKSPLCIRINSHSIACLQTMSKCILTAHHKCVHSTILDVRVYYLPPLCYIHRFNGQWNLCSTVPLKLSFIKICQKFSAETCMDGLTLFTSYQYELKVSIGRLKKLHCIQCRHINSRMNNCYCTHRMYASMKS